MSNSLFISNIKFENFFESHLLGFGDRYIVFNPWGFSRIGIITSLKDTLSKVNVLHDAKIYVCIKPLFYGRRSSLVFEAVVNLYPSNEVMKVSEDELILLLNNSSV
jgi:hypothetical protein